MQTHGLFATGVRFSLSTADVWGTGGRYNGGTQSLPLQWTGLSICRGEAACRGTAAVITPAFEGIE
jgi:hypothetical protein